jgi:hypothetical protein
MSTNDITTGCSACKLSNICTPKDNKEKCVPRIVALRAIMWAFGLPLLLMLVVMVIATAKHCGEGLTALLMLGSLIPYYIILRLNRNNLL